MAKLNFSCVIIFVFLLADISAAMVHSSDDDFSHATLTTHTGALDTGFGDDTDVEATTETDSLEATSEDEQENHAKDERNTKAVLLVERLILKQFVAATQVSLRLKDYEHKDDKLSDSDLNDYVKALTNLGTKEELQTAFNACSDKECIYLLVDLLRSRLEVANRLLGNQGYFEINPAFRQFIDRSASCLKARYQDDERFMSEYHELFSGFANKEKHLVSLRLPREIPPKLQKKSKSILTSAINWLEHAREIALSERSFAANTTNPANHPFTLPKMTAFKHRYVITCKDSDGAAIGISLHVGKMCNGEDGRNYDVKFNGVGPTFEAAGGVVVIAIMSRKNISPSGKYVGVRGGLGYLLGGSVGGFFNLRKQAVAMFARGGEGMVVTAVLDFLVIQEIQ